LQPYIRNEQIMLCPSGHKNPKKIDSANGKVLHYGMNNYNCTGALPLNCISGLSRADLAVVAAHAETIYVADAEPESSPENIGGAQSGTLDWPLTSLEERRHSRGYNALYLDGHVKWRPNTPNHKEWAARME